MPVCAGAIWRGIYGDTRQVITASARAGVRGPKEVRPHCGRTTSWKTMGPARSHRNPVEPLLPEAVGKVILSTIESCSEQGSWQLASDSTDGAGPVVQTLRT